MKRFKYRLQRVLDFRERIQEERLAELSLRIAEQESVKAKILELDQAAMVNYVEEGLTYSAEQFVITKDYQSRIKQEMALAQQQLEEASIKVAEAREAYIQASKDAKALTKLKEKKRAEYDLEINQQEVQFLDEITTQRMARRKRA